MFSSEYEAEIERLRSRCREIDDEAFEYAEQVEALKAERDRLREALEELVYHDSHRDPGEVAVIARQALGRDE